MDTVDAKARKWPRKSLVIQFGWAFMLMSLIPIVMALTIIFVVDANTVEDRIQEASIAVFWMIVSSVAGYFVIRRAVTMLSSLTRHVRGVISGALSKDVLLEQDNELGELTRYFDSISRSLETKVDELETSKRLIQSIFHKIGEAATSSRGIDSLLELILQSMSTALKGEGGFIMLASPDGEMFEPSIVCSLDNKPPKMIPIKAGSGPIGRALRQSEPAIISGQQAKEGDLPFESVICVPLSYKGKAIGVIGIYNKKQGAGFSEEGLELFKDVASQTAMAISDFQLSLDVEKAYLDTIRALAMAVEAKDAYSGGHLERVANYATSIGRRMGLSGEDLKILHDVGYLHDLGKIGIRDDILLKEGKLTAEEYEEMKKHPIIGETIMKPVKSLAKLCTAVRGHQERWDGSGYPDGLKGENIPLHARILAVADVYDALTTKRSYKEAMTKQAAAAELKRCAGVTLDKKIVETFLETI